MWWEILKIGMAVHRGGIYGNSVLFPQFCCEPLNCFLKNKQKQKTHRACGLCIALRIQKALQVSQSHGPKIN
jgi:hypothetical protein